MRDELIQKATRVFYDALCDDDNSMAWVDVPCPTLNECVIDGEVNLERAMTAAFDAMIARLKHPSEEMIEAGARAASAPLQESVDDVIPYDECDNLFRREWEAEVRASLTAMIETLEAEQ